MPTIPHIVLALLVLASPALAAEATRPIDCRCRANGQNFSLGERTCLLTPDGFRLAKCRMVQNVTSWQVEPDGCVVSELLPERTQQR